MGTNYYFIPKQSNYDIFHQIEEKYNKKLKDMIDNYIEEIDNECNRILMQSPKVEDIYKDIYMLPYEEWYSKPWLISYDLDKLNLHICKLSMGWKPLFEKSEFYSNMQELKEFYEETKNYLNIVDEYGEIQDFNKLLKTLRNKKDSNKNQTHSELDYNFPIEIDEDGYEWHTGNFS